MQFMSRFMNLQRPTDEAIHSAFAQGEAAVMALFHDVAVQVTELAQQLAKQGELSGQEIVLVDHSLTVCINVLSGRSRHRRHIKDGKPRRPTGIAR
jgi:hypothetical protein